MSASTSNRNWTLRPLTPTAAPGTASAAAVAAAGQGSGSSTSTVSTATAAGQSVGSPPWRVTSGLHLAATQTQVSRKQQQPLPLPPPPPWRSPHPLSPPLSPLTAPRPPLSPPPSPLRSPLSPLRPPLRFPPPLPPSPPRQPHAQPHATPRPRAASSPTASSQSPHQHHHHQLGPRASPITSFASSFLSFASDFLSPPQSPLSRPDPLSSSTPDLEPTSANALTPRNRRRRLPVSEHHRVLAPCSLVSDHSVPPVLHPHHTPPSDADTTTTTTKHHPFEFLQTYNAPFGASSSFVGFPQRVSLFQWSVARFTSPSFVFEAAIVPNPSSARHDIAVCLRRRLSSPPPRKTISDHTYRHIDAPPERLLLDYDRPSRSTTPQSDDIIPRCMSEEDHVARGQRILDQVTANMTLPPSPSPFQTMNDPPKLLRPTRQLSIQSPTRHRHTASVSDDFLLQLAPHSAVDALASSTGSLRACLDGASASERDFTMRTAMASKMIWSWVQELSAWPWPEEGGAAGFETPDNRRRKPAVRVTVPEEDEKEEKYMGSLRAEDVAIYEARIETIHRDMMELEVEDIKSHVLTEHILPLSRPSTPMSGTSRSSTPMSTGSSYNKMEDLSAAITAIVVQTLPNLAKLSRLLQTWGTRLRVLQQVPHLLLAIEDAEVALLSGWNAITAPAKMSQQQPLSNNTNKPLSREHYAVMKGVVEKKVITGGRIADYMLDCLEGQADTLPDEWLDRLEKVELDYVEWVAACERRVQETEWMQDTPATRHETSDDARMATKQHEESHVQDNMAQEHTEGKKESVEESDAPGEEVKLAPSTNFAVDATSVPVVDKLDEPAQPNKVEPEILSDVRETHFADAHQAVLTLDGTVSDSSMPSLAPSLPIVAIATAETETNGHTSITDAVLDEDSAYPDLDDDLDLPPMRSDSRRNSDASQTSTVLHGASSHFEGSDMPEISASPDIGHTQIREAEYIATSPPSSPPLPKEEEPERKFKPVNISVIDTVPEDDESPQTPPLDGSFVDDFDDSFSVSEAALGSPSKRRDSTGDIHLRQQISQIIESIPAKIKLTDETPNVNLNPPDLQLPKIRKRPSIDRFKRSGSALSTVSSRSGTPAFTLSPAKNPRPSRAQRGQREIKVYHLSRSTGEAPIKLFIRCVGENGERVMVRVGGGWADLSEYLKEYASHHKRRSAAADGPKVEVRDVPRVPSGRTTGIGSSPPSRPGSALDSPLTPLNVRKPRRSTGAFGSEAPRLLPRTPAAAGADDSLGAIPQSEESMRSRSSSRLSWVEDDSSFLGLAGPSGKRVEMSEENKAWVESVKEKVRLASGERRVPPLGGTSDELASNKGRFGELGKVGGTKRLFRKSEDIRKK